VEVVLVTPDHEHFHAAMTAGMLRGAYDPAEARIDVDALAARAGARMVHASADALLPDARVLLAGDERLPFDACVLDDVGPPIGAGIPGVTRHAIPLRPASIIPEVRTILERRLGEHAGTLRCTVVGGGSTGVECAFLLQRLLRRRAAGGVVTIVDAEPRILRDLPACRALAHLALERAGVCFALGVPVTAVREDAVVLASGAELPGDLVIWATEGAPPPLIAASGLPHDARGRLVVDASLRSRDGALVWAAEDCAALDEADRAAQQSRLARALSEHLGAPRLRARSRRREEPCLLDTGDGRALLRRGALTAYSRLAWWLKQRIDRRTVARLNAP
jgi:NADH dehydrogenase FAD-containing subunit